jgi:pimeloyl-ACP methyl ester carboxylesterase
MGQYVDIGDVNTWYDEDGSGEPLILLHGGLCTNETWGAQTPAFAERFRVVAPERRGHGHTADVPGPLTYDAMAADTIGFLDKVVGGPAHLVGWSDGGIVALLVAMSRPDLVNKMVVIGTNYDVDGLVEGMEDAFANMDPNGDEMAMFRSLYQMSSPDGPDHWPVVFGKFGEMTRTQPRIVPDELGHISNQTLVIVGDDDMISLEHTVSLFRLLPNAELAVVPGTSHAVALEKPELLNRLILDFIEHDPVATLIPIRRAPAES